MAQNLPSAMAYSKDNGDYAPKYFRPLEKSQKVDESEEGDEYGVPRWDMPKNTGFSEENCAYCKAPGAECTDVKGTKNLAFCHEDCFRAYNKMKPCAESFFQNSKPVLCGYETKTGSGGFCVTCTEKPALIASSIGGYDFGFCSQDCAVTTAQNITTQTRQTGAGIDDIIPRLLRKKIFHKSYTTWDVEKACIMLWERINCLAPVKKQNLEKKKNPEKDPPKKKSGDDEDDGDDGENEKEENEDDTDGEEKEKPEPSSKSSDQDPYDFPMAEVFAILMTKKHWENAKYNAFARFSEFNVEKAKTRFESLNNEMSQRQKLRKEKKIETGKADECIRSEWKEAHDQHNRYKWDPRFIAKILNRMFKLYYYQTFHLTKERDHSEALKMSKKFDRSMEELKKSNGLPLDEAQNTLVSDLHAIFHNIEKRYGITEATTLMKDALFMEVTNEKPFGTLKNQELLGSVAIGRLVQSEFTPGVKPIAPNWFQKQWQRVKDNGKKVVYAKGYSVHSVVSMLYELWLMNNCGTNAARQELNYKDKLTSAFEIVKEDSSYNSSTWNEFMNMALKTLERVRDMQESRGKMREQTDKAKQKGCEKKRSRAKEEVVERSLAKEILGMYRYYTGATKGVISQKNPPKKNQSVTPAQANFNEDLAMIFKELAKKVGSSDAYSYLESMFNH